MNKTERLEKEKISISSQDRDLNGEVLVYTGVYDRLSPQPGRFLTEQYSSKLDFVNCDFLACTCGSVYLKKEISVSRTEYQGQVSRTILVV